jgi:hypothetical protein
VRVAASGAMRKRIAGALEAGAISMVSSDSALIPDVDVILIDLVEPTSVRRLRVKPGQAGTACIVLVLPGLQQPRSTTDRTRRRPSRWCSRTKWNERTSRRSGPSPGAPASSRPPCGAWSSLIFSH